MKESQIQVSKRIFPRRQLPQNFHGTIKPMANLARIHQQKLRRQLQRNPEDYSPKKIVNWQRKITDTDIRNERRQFLVHPAKISNDTPDWFKTTFDKFRRNEQIPRHRQTRPEWERYDVFGRQKKITYADQTSTLKHRFSQPFEITGKIGTESRLRSTSIQDVAPKVGAVDHRDFSIRKPQMKVGKADFIDTYTPF